jgi:general secretion pathway protein K
MIKNNCLHSDSLWLAAGNLQYLNNRKGFALLLVTWVITALMVVVLTFSFITRVETSSSLSFKEMIERKFISEAGIQRGIMEIFYFNYKNVSSEGQSSQVIDETDLWRTDGRPYEGKIKDGTYSVKIVDEQGKIDINTAPEILLRNLFKNIGLADNEADSIVDSIMDWKDKDDLHRLNGAESDYYMSLPTPYKAKNENFDTVEELLLVKGMSTDILFGSENKKGVIDFLTVHSRQQVINVNSAPKEVLMAIPNMTEEMANSIIDYRKDKRIRNINEIQEILGTAFNQILPYISVGNSNIFTIESTGFKGDNKKGYTIKAIIMITGSNNYKYLYYKSPS